MRIWLFRAMSNFSGNTLSGHQHKQVLHAFITRFSTTQLSHIVDIYWHRGGKWRPL